VKTEGGQRIRVLANQAGKIVAAVVVNEQPEKGEAVVTLGHVEGHILHDLTIPRGAEGDEIFASIGKHYVRTDSGEPHLALKK
jgi:hypothetical protein